MNSIKNKLAHDQFFIIFRKYGVIFANVWAIFVALTMAEILVWFLVTNVVSWAILVRYVVAYFNLAYVVAVVIFYLQIVNLIDYKLKF